MPSRPGSLPAPARRQILRLAAAGALLAPLGCDVPTDAPRLETRWVVPAEVTSFGVDDLLPGDVSVAPDASVLGTLALSFGSH